MILHDLIKDRIIQNGPLSLADYMSDCLLHSEHGYYTTRDPLGADGDFTTAPEISQMFGELIGLCLAQAWIDQGSPASFSLAELGPGRGTLMADALRATRSVPGFHQAAQLHLIEASPPLKEAQRQALAPFAPQWHDTVETLPDLPLFLIANEFFDALPITQFVRDEDGWRERQIGLQNDTLVFGLGPRSQFTTLQHRLEDTQQDDLVELCAAGVPILSNIAHRIAETGGAALIIDYGDWRSLGDTLQALCGHTPTDPLGAPGQADLTAHVDFEVLAATAKAAGCAHSRVTPQGVFLERLGITTRAQALAQTLIGQRLDSHISAHRRLTHPEEMGNLFKVLGLFPTHTPPPPGLES